MRRAARVDDNHSEIVKALRAAGAVVVDLSAVGKGCPDLLIYRRNVGLRLFECKDGAKSASRRALTPDQVEFHAKVPVTIVLSAEQAIEALTA